MTCALEGLDDDHRPQFSLHILIEKQLSVRSEPCPVCYTLHGLRCWRTLRVQVATSATTNM